jgi:hypothetical protein
MRLRPASAALCIFIVGTGLSGCGTTDTIFGNNEAATNPVATSAPAEPPKPQIVARIALAPVIGAPDAMGQQLRAQVVEAAERNRIAIVADRDPSANFGMRGYLVAARDKAGVKVSYIWDVTDPSGKRVNRITGEELAQTVPAARDPWGSVTPAVTKAIADRLGASLGAWAPSQSPSVPVAAAPVPVAPGATAAPNSGPVAANATTAPGVAPVSTAAIPANGQATSPLAPVGGNGMPVVSGAPGDGNTALATALQRELVRQGMPLDAPGGRGFKVDGRVVVGAVKEGRQSIQIDWRVKDSSGNAIGTVTQKNAIPPGSLDTSWGQTADAAAAAAAQGIIKLLPQQSAAARTTN